MDLGDAPPLLWLGWIIAGAIASSAVTWLFKSYGLRSQDDLR